MTKVKFDESKVYTAKNADELKIGSMIITADTYGDLKQCVLDNEKPEKLLEVLSEYTQYRFKVDNEHNSEYALAYLVEEPTKLNWTELKVGDVIRKGKLESMVIAIDRDENACLHILSCISITPMVTWIDNEELGKWEKVENGK